jgi:hypothetical protein
MDTGTDFGPVKVGMVGNVKRRGGRNSVSNAGRGLSKVIGSNGCGWECGDG